MGRPPTPVGTHGEIKCNEIKPGRWEARTRFRLATGNTKQLRRAGKTKAGAIRNLQKACTTLADEITSGEISTTSRVAFVAAKWFEELERESKIGDLSPGTVRTYGSTLRNWVVPVVGELRMNRTEMTAAVCDRVVKKAQDKSSYDTAKLVRAVLSNVCAFAIRHGCLEVNPVRSIARLPRGEQREVEALDAEQRADLHLQLQTRAVERSNDELGRSLGNRGQVWADLPDLYEGMLSTGIRIGELLAISGEEVDPAERLVRIDWHIIRVTGQGLVRRRKRKGNAAGLTLRVPEWSVPMWRRRKLGSGGGPLWPSWNGQWLDPSNTVKRIRQAMDDSGYGWVTSHVFRHTVATVLDEAGLPIGAVADQLGNTRAVAEKHYVARRVANAESADALEGMLDSG
jgi:integrase